MSVIKVIEIMAESEKGYEDAIQKAVKAASESVRGIRSVYVEHMSATVKGKKVVSYRVDTKISFSVER